MSNFLFDEFPPVSSKQWKQKIQFDLKGAEYNKTLLTHTNEGISIKPFYHQNERDFLEIPKAKEDFKICQSIFISDEITANFLALDSLKRGATSILFIADEPFNISELLKNINCGIHFQLNFLSEKFSVELANFCLNTSTFINIDIIENHAKSGNWYFNLKQDFEIIKNIKSQIPKNTSLIKVDASLYQNSGANIIQQVAYALAHGNEYLNFLGANIASEIQFNFSVGSNYFFEIAKLRAFRYLWKLLCEEYNFNIEPHLFIQPTFRNKTLYDFNSNMLRTTTECMSAILGGANTICNISYDSVYHKKNEFGERIARNQLLILKEESYFKNASDITTGTYYIESLTKEITEKALIIFKDIEKAGGFLKLLKEGTIQRKIKESADKEQSQFDSQELILIGTNKHPIENEKMNGEIELFPFVKTKPRKTTIEPIIAKRLSEKIEKERLKNEA
ncbi:methylmalonyl-CoA mutase subunit beta [Urechidicola croceus]|uniref:Methylmalonyl-CoA mutase n=1 Tax=Urechidicola croceus TaxID=1850246 RepID=A0A1D8PAX2_9FLAO|nr:methylmalonyl-CoA mutase subunit beta [Urechidicola croceus]AOW21712.1 methylmalonyl-CoA mutase [Urechidicola croceus]